MSLGMMERLFERCVFMVENTGDTSDARFGTPTTWTEGERFRALVVRRSATERRIAERRDGAETYDVAVEREQPIHRNDVFVTLADGACYRVTSDPVKAAAIGTVEIATVSAERWEVPT